MGVALDARGYLKNTSESDIWKYPNSAQDQKTACIIVFLMIGLEIDERSGSY